MTLIDQFRGVRPKIIPSQFDYGHSAEVVEAQGTLVRAFLLSQFEIEHAAEVKRVRKDVALNFSADRLQLLKVLFLEFPHLWALDFSGSKGLPGCQTRDTKKNESRPPASIFARKQFRELRKGDRKPSECRR